MLSLTARCSVWSKITSASPAEPVQTGGMRMQHTASGRGYPKLIFTILVLGAIAYVAVKTIPIYVHNYELQDFIRQLAIRATVNRTSAETVQNDILAEADELDLPIRRRDVKVTVNSAGVTIELDYTVPVDLKVYTWVLHFTPTATNRAL